MDGTGVALIITALSTLVGVAGGIVVQLRGQNEARAQRAKLSEKMEQVKTATDGMSERLGEAKLAQGTAEGHAVGLEQSREETKNGTT
jgi:flagellar biosynthesis/type III secretory pathway protein FliH